MWSSNFANYLNERAIKLVLHKYKYTGGLHKTGGTAHDTHKTAKKFCRIYSFPLSGVDVNFPHYFCFVMELPTTPFEVKELNYV